jgi:hypothetical protein
VLKARDFFFFVFNENLKNVFGVRVIRVLRSSIIYSWYTDILNNSNLLTIGSPTIAMESYCGRLTQIAESVPKIYRKKFSRLYVEC